MFNNESIIETAKKVRSGEVTAVELAKEHIKRAKTRGQELNAFITVTEEYALQQAAKVDELVAQGKDPGPLAGVPCTVKDVIMTQNIRTTASSQLLSNFVAPYSATVVTKIEEAGAVMIGKTNCDPFAYGGSGENSGFGPAKNPVNEEHVPGGSSSGAAAAQAAGIGLFALGTDTGGSVRQPGSFTGIVGFKPTYGRNSRYGLIAMASSFDTVGVLAQTVEDVAVVQGVLAGKDERDATTYEIEVPNYTKELDEGFDFKGLRIGIPAEFFAQGIDPEVEKSVKAAISAMDEAGAEIVELDLPILKYGIATYYVLVPSEISSNMARFDGVRYGQRESDDYYENIVETRGKYMEDEVKRRVMIGTYTLSAGYADAYYKQATKVRTKITQEMDKLFEKVDVIVGPTSPTPAFKLGERTDDPIAMYLADAYTVIANLTGVPGISVNCGESQEGLPIGIQFMTPKFTESKLFKIAAGYSKL